MTLQTQSLHFWPWRRSVVLFSFLLLGTLGCGEWLTSSAEAAILVNYNSRHKYRQIRRGGAGPSGWTSRTYNDRYWASGQAAYGTPGCGIPIRTRWNLNTELLVRTRVNLPNGGTSLVIRVLIDNDIRAIYFNGTLITGYRRHEGCPTYNSFNFNVPNSIVVKGVNIVAFHVVDRGGSAAFDARIDGTPKTNRAPTISGPSTVTVYENRPVRFSLRASDPDGHSLRWTIPSLPSGARVTGSGNSRTFSWTPNYNQAGTYNLTFAVTDNGSPNRTTRKTVRVIVYNVNRTPSISGPTSQTIDENKLLRFSVSASDPDSGDTLRWTISGLPSGARVTGSGNRRTFSWTPNFNQAGGYTVTFRVTDTGNLSATLTTRITVRNINRPPKFTSTAPTVATENQRYRYPAKATDPDVGDTLTWTLTTGPRGSSVNATGVVTWTPGDKDAEKSFLFVLRVCDRWGACVWERWTVKVKNVNDPPKMTGTPSVTATENAMYTFAPGVTDPDPGDSHTWTLEQKPSGATIDKNTGKIAWTPGDADAEKTFSFKVKVCDKAGACATKIWTVKVKNVNDPPKLTDNPPTVAIEKKVYSYTPTLSDPDPGDTHTWTLEQKPSGATIDKSTGKISWTPGTKDANKSFTFKVKVCDKAGACATKTWTVKVRNVNDPPKLTGTPSTSATEDQKYSFKPGVTDPDPGDSHTWTLEKGPSVATVNGGTGEVSWAPGDADAGKTFTFTLKVCDKANVCDTKTWKVSVKNVNDPPRMTGTPSVTATENITYTFAPGVIDPDPGDSHTWTLEQKPSGATIDKKTGKISWTPGDADAEKTFTFKVKVCDKVGACATKTWTVKVKNVNDPPKITSTPSASAVEDKVYRYKPSATDPDPNDTLSWQLKKGPTSATVGKSTGYVSWTPGDADAEQSFVFEIEVCDKAGACATQKWTVKVQNVNDPPKLSGIPDATAIEDKLYTYAPGVTDPDPGDKVTWSLKKSPKGATIDKKTGKVSWTPGDADAGKTFEFEIKVCDKAGACATKTWKVTVKNVNDSPKITSTPDKSAIEGKVYRYKPTATDPDPGDTHRWSLKFAPSGTTLDPSTGEVVWVPGSADAGKSFNFEIEVCDKAGACDKQAWKVTVKNVNDPPKVVGTPPVLAYVGEKLSYKPIVTDPDPGDTHTWTLKKGPVGAKVDPNTGEVTWTPAVGDAGKKHEFVIEVCDNGTPKSCVTQTFQVLVEQRCKIDSDCPTSLICVAGQLLCRPAGCSTQSPKCPSGKFCLEGKCIDNPCRNTTCTPGSFCRPNDGKCIKSCGSVTCQKGDVCKEGVCQKDPCAANPCKAGELCNASDPKKPICVKDPCQSGICKHGRLCVKGRCLDDPCALIQCPNTKYRCLAGECVVRKSCQVDLDCPQQQVCLTGRCFPPNCYDTKKACTGGKLCLSGACNDDPCANANCQSGEFCRRNDGACSKPCASVSCAKNQRCQDGVCQPDPCSSVTCSAGTVCVKGACVRERCNASNVCKFGRLCLLRSQTCDDDPCAGVKCPDSRQVCREGQCVAPPSCVFDKDCPGAQLCAKGKCINPACQKNTDCQQDEICLEGQCQKDTCAGKTCPNHQLCRAGQCVGSCAGVFCKTGEVCVDGKCVNDACAGKQCQAGEACVNGTCVTNPCATGSCKQGRVCRPGGCFPDPCQSLSCPSGQACKAGQCEGDRTCQNDAGCPGAGVCIEKVCKPAGCYAAPCTGGKICLKGQCADNPCANKQCGSDEVCRPRDGLCVKRCTTCPQGQRCKNGVCESDPCDSINCQSGERCEEGQCVKDPCVTAGNGLCKYQRWCRNAGCSDDPCLAVSCPADHTCRQGVCYGAPTPPELAEEPADEGTDVVEEATNSGEFQPESTADASPETVTKESGQSKEEDKIELRARLQGGGCACHEGSTIGTFWLLLLVLLGVLVLRKRTMTDL